MALLQRSGPRSCYGRWLAAAGGLGNSVRVGADGEAFASVLGLFDFVEDGDGEVFHGDVGLAGGVDE